jgi:hypothetical protein
LDFNVRTQPAMTNLLKSPQEASDNVAWRICPTCCGLSRPPAYLDRCPCGAKTRPATQAEIEARGAAAKVRDAVAVRGRTGGRQ